MTRANLTLQLDADVIRRARIVAAKRGTSVSALAATQLTALVDEDERVELARERAQAILRKASARGGRTWTRDELHDREGLRDR
jgi:plasmid stability protein